MNLECKLVHTSLGTWVILTGGKEMATAKEAGMKGCANARQMSSQNNA